MYIQNRKSRKVGYFILTICYGDRWFLCCGIGGLNIGQVLCIAPKKPNVMKADLQNSTARLMEESLVARCMEAGSFRYGVVA